MLAFKVLRDIHLLKLKKNIIANNARLFLTDESKQECGPV